MQIPKYFKNGSTIFKFDKENSSLTKIKFSIAPFNQLEHLSLNDIFNNPITGVSISKIEMNESDFQYIDFQFNELSETDYNQLKKITTDFIKNDV